MSDIPTELIDGLQQPAREAAARWWDQLTVDERAAVVALSSTDFDTHSAPRLFGGKFLADDEAADWSDWFAAYFEHLVAHPESVFHEPPVVRTFYIG